MVGTAPLVCQAPFNEIVERGRIRRKTVARLNYAGHPYHVRSPKAMISRVSLVMLTAASVLGITCALIALHWEPSNPESQPLDFDIVVARLKELPFHPSREEVEALLGPPTERISGFEFAEEEIRAEWNSRHVGIPEDRYWVRWSDPNNDERYLAILFAGHYPKYHAYLKVRRGF
jgi:hypothetical protein